MDSILKWVAIIGGGILLAVCTFFLIKRNINAKEITEDPSEVVDDGIREKLIKYLNQYKEDWKKYRFVNYYSKQFDIKTNIKNYTMKVKRIATISDLGIDNKDRVTKEISKIIESEIGIKPKNSKSSESLFFLQNYYELDTEKVILEEIRNKINGKDLERFNKYKNDIDSRIADLVKNAKIDFI